MMNPNCKMGRPESALSDLPDLLTVLEVASILRIGRGKAYMLVRTGELPSLKLGRTLRIPKPAVERLAGISSTPTGNDNE